MSTSVAAAIDVLAGTLRAVDYLRVSTEDQAKGYGIAYTGKKTTKYIALKGWKHVGTYADEGVSGSLEAHERDDLKRLMEDAHKTPRPFDMVVVNEGRAIGRTGKAFWRWVWILEELGIYVAVVRDDYDNSTESGRKQMRKDADYAEEERENIRTRTQGGIQEKAEEGGYVGGKIPFGYRILNKGVKGESRLGIDDCDCFEDCSAYHEVLVARRARALFVVNRNWRATALKLNAEGLVTRSGRPWRHQNLRNVMLSSTMLESVQYFRTSRNTKFNVDGTPRFGGPVAIALPPIFTPQEVAELKAAAHLRARPVVAECKNIYPLSGRIDSLCGSHYTGLGRSSAAHRFYRCKGAEEGSVKNGGCGCSRIDAEAIDSHVWNGICQFLGNAEELKKLAEDWVGVTANQTVNHDERIEQLDAQIEEQQSVLNVVAAFAVKSAIQRGKSEEEAQKAAEEAVKPQADELAELERQLREVRAWKAETEGATNRALHLRELAKIAHKRLGALSPEQQAEFMDLMNIKVEIVGSIPVRRGRPCSVAAWFHSHKREVPILTDEGWARVKDMWDKHSTAHDRRRALEGVLYKARTGCRWPDVPVALYGPTEVVRSSWVRWNKNGMWDELMKRLAGAETQPAHRHVALPDVRVTGELIPELILSATNGHLAELAPSVDCAQVPIKFQLSLAA